MTDLEQKEKRANTGGRTIMMNLTKLSTIQAAVADWPATAIVAEMRALLFVIGHAA